MNQEHKIELLSPAKNAETGIEAILHGADAVYIGASEFGARKAAGNDLDDISKLVEFAHIYGAKVYVTVNTIIKENEIKEVEKLIHDLYRIGVDALIVQDFGILKMNLPPIGLHASTQMNNTTPERVKFLEDMGYSQVVLARECTRDDIKSIKAATNVKLEAFIHGALCVSYSGRCYASAALTGRSANRGECAQICRLPFQLQDAHGHNLGTSHYLSLKDMDHSADIEDMIESGITSFKIEGRLKDVDYVKNITAYYRGLIDNVLAKHPEWHRSSDGISSINFTPNKYKSFFRGGTSYFYGGRNLPGGMNANNAIYSPFTPKSIGEYVGTVKSVKGKSIVLNTQVELHNGDGLCYQQADGTFMGFRVNSVNGTLCQTLEQVPVTPGAKVFRNYDIQFQTLLGKPTATRKISVEVTLNGDTLTITDGVNNASVKLDIEGTKAEKDQSQNIKNTLNKLGETPFFASNITVNTEYFIPMSILTAARRSATEKLVALRRQYALDHREHFTPLHPDSKFSFTTADYTENVANSLAKEFYHEHGVESVAPAFEVEQPVGATTVMFCKHCIRYMLGACKKEKTPLSRELAEPLHLIHKNYYLRLEFDCKACVMKVISEN